MKWALMERGGAVFITHCDELLYLCFAGSLSQSQFLISVYGAIILIKIPVCLKF